MDNLGWIDRYPRANCAVSVLLGIGLYVLGVMQYYDIVALEGSDGETSVTCIFRQIYEIAGVFGAGVVFILGGAYFLFRAYTAYGRIPDS